MKNIKFIIFVLILVLLNLSFLQKFEKRESGYDKVGLIDETVLKTIKNNYKYEEDINITNDHLKYLDIYFNVDNVEETFGEYNIEVYKDKTKILEKEVNYNLVKSTGKYRLSTKNIKKGNYKLVIKYKGKETNFTLAYQKNNNEKIQLQYYYLNVKKCALFYTFIIISTILLVVAFFILEKKKELSVEKRFLIIAIPIFIAFTILMPMFIAHDERFHWFRIYEITEGGLLPEIRNNSTGYEMPDAVYTSLPYSNRKYTDVKEGLKDKLDKNNKSFISDVTMSVYSPVQYAPHVLGVIVGKLVTDRPVLIAFIGRFFNMIVSIILLYFAIKKMPFGKNIMLLFSIIPIAIEGFTSLSGDGFTICISYLLIAYILNLTKSKQKKLLKKDYAILLSLGTILAFCKLVYIPLVFLLYLLPEKYFKSKKDKIIKITLTCIILLGFNLIWLKLANPYLSVYTGGKSSYQVKYIFENIIRYVEIFLYSFFTQIKDLISSMYGDTLLWSDYIHNYPLVSISLITMTMITCVCDQTLKKQLSVKSSIIMSVISVAIVGLIYTSLYVQWTPYANPNIIGVQGRYFLPFIPLLFIVIGNFIKKDFKMKENSITQLILITAIIVNYMSIIEMIIEFI